jgi:hypothetical protein
MRIDDLSKALHPHGLLWLGDCPDGADTIALVGPDEPRFWGIFCQSDEYRDGDSNPLDRWSRRVVSQIAEAVGGAPLFPFGGAPYAPFFTWAVQSGRCWGSPIGFLVHDEAGLFVSFRGAIRMSGQVLPATGPKPCDSCAGTPCATACPVGAFNDGYDVVACKTHVASEAGQDCRTAGCLARRACPIGQGNRLPAQAAFHMEAFL